VPEVSQNWMLADPLTVTENRILCTKRKIHYRP
jgi:hypothetical protein